MYSGKNHKVNMEKEEKANVVIFLDSPVCFGGLAIFIIHTYMQ